MNFISIAAPGAPEVLTLATGPVPKPGRNEVLIRVKAAGINRADLLQRKGHYPVPPGASPILGMEVSGEIVKLGPEYSGRWSLGDSVCALLGGGGYAEYCVAPAGQCLPIPQGVSVLDAAALPEATVTVWANLFEPRRLYPGELFLVQGGSSGIGSMAIQIAHCFGARVAATAGSEEKCRYVLGLGAEKAVNYRTGDWAAELLAWSKPRSGPEAPPQGINVILDMVGGDYFAKHLELLAPRGRLVHIAFLAGSRVTVDLRAVIRKRLLITGSTLRDRTVEEKSALISAVEHELWPLFESRGLRPTVSQVFPLSEAAEAHRRMEEGNHMGKLLLAIGTW
ncbi:MAG TPA: NAD(P)H-quinone oxidoreductase [Acidobacteriaceae bacterium]